MAAEEIEPLARIAPERKGAGPGTAVSGFGRHRRPVMMAVGAILLAIMSYPLVNTLVRGDKAPAAPAVEHQTANPCSVTASRTCHGMNHCRVLYGIMFV